MDLQEAQQLTKDLCRFASGVVADDNQALFDLLNGSLDFTRFSWTSGDEHLGWVVPQNWRVESATISRDGRVVFDGTVHTLAVARYSRSFQGRLAWDELRPHLVTNPALPDAYMFHCMWQYRPWAADWALSVPYNTFAEFGPGDYDIDLRTSYEPGEMIVAHYDKVGRSDRTIVFHSNNCHPHQANDGFAGTATLVRLFSWLADLDTFYSYRLVIGPEHLGTVFYLRDLPVEERERIVAGAFVEMPGTRGPVKVASSFLGQQPIDRAFAQALRDGTSDGVCVGWRQGAGNDETVWEAPGYEVPFVEVTRSEVLMQPYREYHSSLDTPELMEEGQLEEFFGVLVRAIEVLEGDAVMHRKFDGLLCLSNPMYDLYNERADPTVEKELEEDSEKWGELGDALLRYFNGSVSLLSIAERHGIDFRRLRTYVERFETKGLIELEWLPIDRPVPSAARQVRRDG